MAEFIALDSGEVVKVSHHFRALAAKPGRSGKPSLGASSATWALPFRRKNQGIRKGSDILLTNDAPVSPESPFFACLYLIAEQLDNVRFKKKL